MPKTIRSHFGSSPKPLCSSRNRSGRTRRAWDRARGSLAAAPPQGRLPQRRGQSLGVDARPGWPGWDVVEAMMPQAEIGDLIVELRSATAGVATFRASFDHMAELTGRLADEVANAHGKAA